MLGLCLFALSASGQTQITGVVKDQQGAVVPKATVLLFSLTGDKLANASTNRDGAFRLPAAKLPEVRLEIRKEGFKPIVLSLSAAEQSKPIAAVLQISDLTQQIDVSVEGEAGKVAVDPTANRDAAVVSDNMLERLPVFDQDYIGAISNFLDQGSTGNMGATIVVDGMEQKDAGVTASAVQSVKINNDPYSAEFSRPGRGRIEVITKTPAPVFHGAANVVIRDYHLDARNAFAASRPPEQKRIFEGVLTGPVARLSRTFFLLSADYQHDNVQSFVFAALSTGLLQQNVPSPVRAKDLAARISHDFSDRHTSTLQFTYEGSASLNQLSSGGINAAQTQTGGGGGGSGSGQNQASGGFVLPEAGRNLSNIERHLKYSDRLVISPSLLNQFQIMYERNRSSTSSTTEQVQISVQNSFVGGGAQATQLNTENNVDVRDVLTWVHKAHTVSAGVAIPNMSRRGLDDYSNRLGTFNFTSLATYVAGQPYSFTQQVGPDHFVYWQKEVGGFVQDQIRISSNLQLSLGARWDWQNDLNSNHNVAPRASIGYAFGKKRITVLRAGSGIFYDRTSARPLGNLAEYSMPVVRSILLLNPTFPDPFQGPLGTMMQPANLYRFSPGIRTPYLILYSASLERQVLRTATVSATYRGSVGVSMFRSLDVNQSLAPEYLSRPNAAIGIYQEVQSSGRQQGQALDISFSGKINRIFSGLAQYTLSRTNNNTAGINYLPPNSYDLSSEYGRADFDQRQRFNTLLSSNPHPWVNLGVGFTAASGLPYTETLGLDLYNTGFANARPAGVGRNTLQGPGYLELDLRWSHDFFLSKQGEKGPVLTFAADSFNLPNRVNDSQFIGNERSPFFGHAVSALPARRLQFTLRCKF